MATKQFLSRLMRMSWSIQRSKRTSRAKALTAAWAILSNEDVTVLFLTRRLNHGRPINAKMLSQMSLFNPVTL